MKIAVYSGSFNPLHIGHLAIMEYLTRKSDFDWVYLVVSPQNPLKDASNFKTGEERYHAAVEAVRRHPDLHVWVDDIELTMDPPHYTIKTLDALRHREPENEFKLVIGADNLADIHRWRDFPRILRDYGVVVFPREGDDPLMTRKALMEECAKGVAGFENLADRLYDIRIMDMPMVNISSTEIRKGLEEGLDMSEYLM